jgi:competence CoiA-like predicted nuclease
MMLADVEGRRLKAEPGLEGICPCCRTAVTPKCGDVKIHHWAHKSLKECDPWWEPTTQWHVDWQDIAGWDKCEIVLGNHRADIVNSKGIVIELQHSPIKIDKVKEREDFYKNMIWLLDFNPNKSARFEAWKSKRGFLYFKLKGRLPKWVDAIEKPKFFHVKFIQVGLVRSWEMIGDKWQMIVRNEPMSFTDFILMHKDKDNYWTMRKRDFVREYIE